jgi:hypothetical protein
MWTGTHSHVERQRSGTPYPYPEPTLDLKGQTAAFVGVACSDLGDFSFFQLNRSESNSNSLIYECRSKIQPSALLALVASLCRALRLAASPSMQRR